MWASQERPQTYGEARVGIHTFSGSGFTATGVSGDVLAVKVMPHNVDPQKIQFTLETCGLMACYKEPYYHEASSSIKSLSGCANVIILFDVDKQSISTVQLKLPSGYIAQYDVLPAGS